MDKSKLAALSREALVARAEELGVRRAQFLTRPELMEAILLAEGRLEADRRGVTRGLVGLARDLLARLVERGLHLPDAAERIRIGTQPPRARAAGESIPTVTLAEIYARQGHLKRALSTLQKVLEQQPDHTEALELREQLQRQAGGRKGKTQRTAAPPQEANAVSKTEPLSDTSTENVTTAAEAHEPAEHTTDDDLTKNVTTALAPEDSGVDAAEAAENSGVDAAEAAENSGVDAAEAAENSDVDAAEAAENSDVDAAEAAENSGVDAAEDSDEEAAEEPRSMLDDGPLPPRYDVDECVALPVDPRTVFVYWELREQTLRQVAERVGDGQIVLRVALYLPSWDGPVHQRIDYEVRSRLGEYFVRDLPEGAVVRVAIGYRARDERFLALGHSLLFEPTRPLPRAAEPHAEAPQMTELLVWRPEGAVPVQRSGREAAFLAEALYASGAPELQQLAQHYGQQAMRGARESLQQLAASWARASRGAPEARRGGSSARL